jgi:hypothetical protein
MRSNDPVHRPLARSALALLALSVTLISSCSSSSDRPASPTAPVTSAPETTLPPPPAEPRELWPAPANALAVTRKAGLTPERAEVLRYHVHAHLDVFLDGDPIIVPSGIGININDPEVVTFPNANGTFGYGGIKRCAQPCISPLHTHDVDGVLHTESGTPVPNRLGQFFTEWGVRLTDRCVAEYCAPETPIAFYVNGQQYDLDPRSMPLTDLTEIALVIGEPPADIPSAFPG